MDFIPLKATRELFLAKPSNQSLWKWVNDGLICRDETGRMHMVYLKVHREAGRVYTSKEWVEEFKEATSHKLRRRVTKKARKKK